MTELEKLEGDVREAAAQRELKQVADPSRSTEAQIGKRLDDNVDACCDYAVSILRDLRDKIDDQMRAFQGKAEFIRGQNRELVELVSQAVEIKSIAEDAITRLSESIEHGMTPTPKVITARKGNGR